jgi:hypothetical protein
MRLRAFLVGGLLVASGPALALDQGDWQLAAGPSYALLVQGNNATAGLGGRLEGRRGLTDVVTAWAAVGSSWHPRLAETVRASNAAAGLAVAFDVLRLVPFLGVGATVSDVRGELSRSRRLGLEGAAGAEYLVDRRWSVAFAARYQYLPIRIGGSHESTGLLTVGLLVGSAF